jgi:hypothetical protein
LDHAVWSLASLRHADPDWTQFPIAETLDADSRKTFNRQLRGIPDEAKVFIESLQPYNRPAGKPPSVSTLWQLHELNRIEKHRRILVRTMMHIVSRQIFTAGSMGDIVPCDIQSTDYGYEITCRGSYKHVQPKLTPYVMFGEQRAGIGIQFSGLEDIYQLVADRVLPTLAGFAQ